MSKPALEQRMAVMLGGRAAELLVFQQTSTGASNDLERATGMARRMVTEFGMSEKLGPVRYVGPAGMDYLGSQVSALNLSPETERMIDEEIRRFLDEAAEEAMKILPTTNQRSTRLPEFFRRRRSSTARPSRGS